MSNQLGGLAWCSSGIIFDSCCDGDLWIVQVECVPFDTVMDHLQAGNNHDQVLQFESLEVWHHMELALVLGSAVLLPELFFSHSEYNILPWLINRHWFHARVNP